MNIIMMRIVFCGVPALIVGVVVALFNPMIGIIAFAVVFAFGIDITKARPDRGESNPTLTNCED